MKSLLFFFLFLFSFLVLSLSNRLPFSKSFAAAKDLPTVTVINPVRGAQLGHEHDDLLSGLRAQWSATHNLGINATWLWQFSALQNSQLVSFAKKEMMHQEFGLFLEIDKNTADASGIAYRGRGPWYFSDGLFLFSYDTAERHKIIDTVFKKFHDTFGYYPKTVGSWWIGADSLTYMQEKYGITGAMRAADQYNLDVYTIWGTPWNVSYIPSRENEGIPASSFDDSSKVVVAQWAARDPLQGYGASGDNGTFSTQDFELKGYNISYFDYLTSLYLQKPLDQIIVGIENSPAANFEDDRHYPTVLREIAKLKGEGKIQISLEKDYAQAFLAKKDIFAPTHTLLSKDYITNDQSFWYTSSTYRVLVRKIGDNIYLSDLRNYAQKTPETFFTLPNSQGNLWINTPAIIDSATFPQQERLIGTSKDLLRIVEGKNTTELLSGNTKLATFSQNRLTLAKSGQIFLFTPPATSFSFFWVLYFLIAIYILGIYARKRDKKIFLQILLLFVPLFLSYGLINTTSTTTFLFDKKELQFSYLLPLFPFSLSWKIIAVFQLVPFLFLLAVHYVSILFKKNYLFFLTVAVVSLLFLHLPYFPLDHSTYKVVGACVAAGILFAGIVTFLIFIKTRSRKKTLYLAGVLLFVLFAMCIALLTSRSREILNPFELDALQKVSISKKDVVYLFPTDIPIYKAIRPLLYDDSRFAANLTHTTWQKIGRDSKNKLTVTDFAGKILFVPRYLGSYIYDVEIERYHLKKIFDNQEIALFEGQ